VDDRQDAIDVRILVQQSACPHSLRNVLAGAGRAIDGADDGDVIARAVALMLGPIRTAVVALEVTRLRRAPRVSGAWYFRAEGVVTLEGVGSHIVDVDERPGGDVAGGEADDLAVLQHRLAGPTPCQ